MRRWRFTRWRTTICGVAAALSILAVLGIAMLATQDVHRRAKESGGQNPRVTLTEASLSFSHGIRLDFDVAGHGELHRGHWYLYPWRSVILEK